MAICFLVFNVYNQNVRYKISVLLRYNLEIERLFPTQYVITKVILRYTIIRAFHSPITFQFTAGSIYFR